jgi:hypothetical protein
MTKSRWIPLFLSVFLLLLSRLAADDLESSAARIATLEAELAGQQQQIAQLRAALEDLTRLVRGGSPPQAARPTPPPTPTLAAGEPEKIRIKNIDLTPGGFVEAATIYRSRNQNADAGSTYGGIPLDATANARLSEFRGTARQSRFSLLAETAAGGTKVSGFLEADFLGAAPTANEVESNSFQPRLRQFWGNADFPNGFSVTVGQMWTLLTTNRRGVRPRSEFFPATIDSNYAVGYNWARQFGARFAKDFGHGVLAAFSVENSETAVGGVVLPAGVLGFNGSPNAQSPSSQFSTSVTPGANGVSTDLAPDLIGKLVFEPGWGHWELKGVTRFFRDRLNQTNHRATGGGAGAAGIMPLHKKVDLLVEGLFGSGIGRYAAAVGPDVAARPDGTLKTVRAAQILTGLEFHPTRAWDLYGFFGLEYYDRTAFTGSTAGYGSPAVDLSACSGEVPGACPQANRVVWQLQPGFWYRFHQGREGTAAFGFDYSYTRRQIWSGLGGLRPTGREHSVMLSMRYYLP